MRADPKRLLAAADGQRADALYNEGRAVYATIRSISESNYPANKFERKTIVPTTTAIAG